MKCPNCQTVLRTREGDEVACGECGARYTVAVRLRGGGAQIGVLRALRDALASGPDACKACQGTGLAMPAAAERAAVRAMLKGSIPQPPRKCGRCKGRGKR